MEKKLYTIGFTKKSAKEFFTILGENNVKSILDIRLNNDNQLNGFSKKEHLPFFLNSILQCKYDHLLILAPTRELFKGFKDGTISWPVYCAIYISILNERQPENLISEEQLNNACLLCSEVTPKKCHRRLAAEYLAGKFPNIRIKHL